MAESIKHVSKNRIRLISIAILLVACLLLVKLYSVQIIKGNDFAERADRQYQKPGGHVFSRGSIFFSEKTIEVDGKKQGGGIISAATVKSGFILAINPKLVAEAGPDTVFNKLKEHIPDLVYEDFLTKATKKNDTYEEIKKRLDEKIGTAIAEAKIPGVSLYKDKWRYYPGGQMAAHTLGILGYTGDDLVAQYGLEKSYDNTLKRDTDNTYVNFFAEMFSNIKKTVIDHESLEGDIVTTIEPDTQQYIENMLERLNKSYSSEKSGAIVMDPKTGEIVALGLYPTFDPNNLKELKDVGVLKNSLVQDVYEMGSVMKPLTMSVGIDLGKVNAKTVYNDQGFVKVADKTIYNFDKKGRGDITLQYALSKSLNTGFVYVAKQVGNDAMRKYFKTYGFGDTTGIDLPHERTGLVSNLESDRDIEFATASFGQGIAMSPIAFIRAYTAIANNGKITNPHLVKKIDYRLGYSKDIDSTFGPQVIKPETAQAVTDMMIYNVDNSLLDGKAKNPRYAVAAKTGTAQIATEAGTYDEYRFLHSFVGFLPAHNPRFIVFIYTVNPRGVSYASETLATPFIDLTKFLINNFKLTPDR